MKKLLILSVTMITMTLLIFNLSSCKKKDNPLSPESLIDQQNNSVLSSAEQARVENYKGNDGLKGAVKTVVETMAYGSNTSTISSKTQTEYNKAGYQTSFIKYTGTNFANKSSETTTTYDNSNFVIGYEFKSYSGTTVNYGSKSEYTITGDEITTNKSYYWSVDKWVLSYYAERTYKSKGKPAKTVNYVVTNGVKTDVVASTTIYTYDNNGNQLTDVTYEGVKAATGDILYKGTPTTYDNNGNWTEKKEYSYDGILSSTTTRTISYY